MQRRFFVHSLATLAATGLATPALKAQTKTPLEVWKDPECGCCGDWVIHMEANGFQVKVHDTGNSAVRVRLGIPTKLGSCHTALVGAYAIEGHVPAREVRRLLKERPQALGLTVPGMPVGSPGMDGAVYGGRQDPYKVLLMQKNGNTRVFQDYPTKTPAKS
ncbi:DUF411 domain-containing protein [Polaromonas sp. SM01]|uniref:DUF411 domain-containing protein n=1 Tax=Polaromonas sp. SM01 TaxID=3085630 RepID=UPI002981F581|nr:DUF411 domain-containing protein [Polaromonas sp. SM01]MDW5443503.1 DUF411 domain-containing protein [Polaromonas sp. SM01]